MKRRLPAISMFRRFAEAGGLMSYGPKQHEYSRRLSVYIDKILRGAKPGDLPVEQATKFDFVIRQSRLATRPGISQGLLTRLVDLLGGHEDDGLAVSPA